MHAMRSLFLSFVTGALLAATAAGQQYAPAVRIVDPIDENNLVALKGNIHPSASAKNDRGRVSDDLPMTDLILVLSRDPAQQAAFEKFVASQYEPTSPNFHQWLTPEQVGENFGPSPNDLAAISSWLTGHGFSIAEVSKDRMSIRFSGTAAEVESAFHTEIHNLEVKGVPHIGNMSDPKIPAALAPAVVGVKSLHNFFPRPLHRMGSVVQRDSATGKWKRTASARKSARPQFVTTDQYGDLIEDVAPYDFAAIYNVLPLWNASSPIDGTGQTIAIAGTSDIDPSDVTAFRTDFGLPTSNAANTPMQIKGANGLDPGMCTSTSPTATCTIDDLIENSLDVEWSGSVAKNAQIVLVTSGSKSSTDDTVYDSASYVVNSTPSVAKILNVSYGLCELGEGTAGNVSYYTLWQTAASEGIAVFVAAGDSGSASCDDGGDGGGANVPYGAEFGLSVSGIASTPYDTAVGGTDLYWCPIADTSCTSPAAQYWNTTNSSTTMASAKGYVPEAPWNDTCASTFGFQVLQEIAVGVGVPGVNDAESACNFAADAEYESVVYDYYGYDMAPLVDTVGGSGGASGCVVNTSTSLAAGSCTAGSTSTGTANGSIALYNDGWVKPSWQAGVPGIPSDGVRDIPDVSFFASDGFLGSAYLICVSEVAACTYSTEAEPFAEEVGGTSVATPAMAGVMALINQKIGSAQGFANQELYTLAAKQAASPGYTSCSAETVTASSSCFFNDIDAGPSFSPVSPVYNNAVPCDYGVSGITSPNCGVLHSGDVLGILGLSVGTPGYDSGTGFDLATGLGSLNIANVVNNWTSTIGTGKTTVTVAPGQSSIAVNVSLSVVVTVASSPAGGTTPTGSVTLSGGGYTSSAETLSSGAYTFTVPAGSLSGGSDTLTASYSGDSKYAPSSGSGSVTVTLLTATVSATPQSASINSNQSLVVTGTVTGSGPTPTGTVTVSYGTTYTSAAATLMSGNYSVTVTPDSLPGGTDKLTANYSGDANYSPAAGSTSVTVTYVAVLNPTVTVTPASTTVDSGSPLLVTVAVAGPSGNPSIATPTGTVSLSGSGYASTTQTLANGTATFNIPANTLASSPTTTVSDTLTAHYQGDPNYAQANGSTTLTVTQSGYSLSATTPAAVAPGSTATTTVSVSSSTDYTGTVTFTSASCVLTGYPSGVTSSTPGNPTCALTAGGAVTMTDGSSSGTVAYTVSTTGATTASIESGRPRLGRGWGDAQVAASSSSKLHDSRSNGSAWFATAGGTLLAALFLFLAPGARNWRRMLGMILLMAAVTLAAVGCGGGGNGSTGTTQSTPTVTVTANPSSVTLGSSTPVSIPVTVTGSNGTPTGSVSVSGGGYTSPSEPLTGGSYTYSIPAKSFTTVGSDVLTASYSGDSNYIAGSGTTLITVSNVPTTAGAYTFTVTPTSSPSFAAQPSTTFTVTVN